LVDKNLYLLYNIFLLFSRDFLYFSNGGYRNIFGFFITFAQKPPKKELCPETPIQDKALF